MLFYSLQKLKKKHFDVRMFSENRRRSEKHYGRTEGCSERIIFKCLQQQQQYR
jgi:hypothetical protein